MNGLWSPPDRASQHEWMTASGKRRGVRGRGEGVEGEHSMNENCGKEGQVSPGTSPGVHSKPQSDLEKALTAEWPPGSVV